MVFMKILIIDDENDLVHLLKYNLENQGYEVIAVNEAEKGLVLARQHSPDLILLDLMLPEMDGFEFCRILRGESNIPIVFLTSSKNDACKNLALKMGANDYISKPFSVDALLSRIQVILSGRDASPIPYTIN